MMKKILKCALVCALALAVLSAAALAAGASIVYRGGGSFDLAPGSGYTDTDLFDNFKDVMPGDELTETITFTNRASDCDYVVLYLRAVAHDEQTNPLTYDEAYENLDGKDQAAIDGERDETVATMSDFLAQLSMEVWNGEELIFEASPDEMDGLAENVKLGTFRRGDSTELTVKLTVPADLGNDYAYRVGEVDWVFHVDALDDPDETISKTGDESSIALYLALTLTAATALVLVTKRKEN